MYTSNLPNTDHCLYSEENLGKMTTVKTYLFMVSCILKSNEVNIFRAIHYFHLKTYLMSHHSMKCLLRA